MRRKNPLNKQLEAHTKQLHADNARRLALFSAPKDPEPPVKLTLIEIDPEEAWREWEDLLSSL